ncbi:hypothetical protein BDA96_02G086000 [Sorghum bicolor]|uniref:Uncharacterized protein n=1 Tax=Sorghum bicolor TaxID=4558 RepID=A0A921RL42_SORBI|nr:hypothetical protein BDA96_02G086000 [Sorghum bicolor]
MSPSGAAIDPGEGNPSRIHAQRIQTSGFLFLAKWSNSNRLPVRCRTGIWRCLPGQVRRFLSMTRRDLLNMYAEDMVFRCESSKPDFLLEER